jgi:hypothetical protein
MHRSGRQAGQFLKDAATTPSSSPGVSRPDHLVIGANIASDRVAVTEVARANRAVVVNTAIGARSRYAHADAVDHRRRARPSVVKHAPGRPITSACAIAAIAAPFRWT